MRVVAEKNVFDGRPVAVAAGDFEFFRVRRDERPQANESTSRQAEARRVDPRGGWALASCGAQVFVVQAEPHVESPRQTAAGVMR